MTLAQLQSRYPPCNPCRAQAGLLEELAQLREKIVVLDDDPTGTQTVHGVPVFTDWSRESIRAGFTGTQPLFFLLTNSRSFDSRTTAEVHRVIAQRLHAQGQGFLLVSRGDSTLRGHYPLETQVLRDTLEELSGVPVDGEILCPFFPEGGRYTAGNIHYVELNGALVPAGETEFAGDKTFGYRSSDLREWVEEKTGGKYPADRVVSITLEELRSTNLDLTLQKLLAVEGFGKVVVNALSYGDIQVFATALLRAVREGKRFLFRTAAAMVRVLGGIPERPLLTREELCRYAVGSGGGLVIAGSHVQKTTSQLEALCRREGIAPIVLDQHLVTQPQRFEQEAGRVADAAGAAIAAGKTAVVYTRRERFDLGTGNKEDELRCATAISDKLTGLVGRLGSRPAFVVAKGGITSSDVATKGLLIRRATVLGQILPGVPVWLTGPESRYPGMPYVIFPGNVGDADALADAVEKLRR